MMDSIYIGYFCSLWLQQSDEFVNCYGAKTKIIVGIYQMLRGLQFGTCTIKWIHLYKQAWHF